MNNPKISIIIPVYNRAEIVINTLKSIKGQLYNNFECIIIDDGSNDNTVSSVMKFIENDHRFCLQIRTSSYRAGGNGARNMGLDLSSGDYVNWFDSDDIMLPNFISDKVDLINNSTDIIIAPHRQINSHGEIGKEFNFFIDKNPLEDFVMWKLNFALVTNNVMFRKQFLFDNLLRFDETLNRCQESDLFCRAFYLNPTIKFSNKIGFSYLIHDGNKSANKNSFNYKHRRDFVYINANNFSFAVRNNRLDLAYYLNCRLIDDLQKYNKESRKLSWYIFKRMCSVLLPKYPFWIFSAILIPFFIVTGYKLPLSQRILYRNIFNN